jgi:hypothetical protein
MKESVCGGGCGDDGYAGGDVHCDGSDDGHGEVTSECQSVECFLSPKLNHCMMFIPY